MVFTLSGKFELGSCLHYILAYRIFWAVNGWPLSQPANGKVTRCNTAVFRARNMAHPGFISLSHGMMIFREALVKDIQEIQAVRNSVKENALSDPALVSDAACEEYLMVRGKGWVCEINNSIVGFAIADLVENNIWALFVHPGYEKKGIGKKLHDIMMDWYFSKSKEAAWLGTSPCTRAEIFYRTCGWREVGIHGKGEIKFEMTVEQWRKNYSGRK